MNKHNNWTAPHFECFFSSIPDYIRGYDRILFSFPCVSIEHYILMKSIRCKGTQIKVNKGEVRFCFWFCISEIPSLVRTLDEAVEISQRILQLELFNDESRNNQICRRKDIRAERGKYDWINGAKYFYRQKTFYFCIDF